MHTLEKLMLGIALLLILLSGLCEVSLKTFVITGLLDFFLLLKIAQKLDQRRQEQQQDTDDDD